jgi:hypothetical protein
MAPRGQELSEGGQSAITLGTDGAKRTPVRTSIECLQWTFTDGNPQKCFTTDISVIDGINIETNIF